LKSKPIQYDELFQTGFNELTFDTRTHIPVWGWGFSQVWFSCVLWPLTPESNPKP